MNLSGTAIRQLQSAFKRKSVSDCYSRWFDLFFGAIRMKAAGTVGLAEGLASIETNWTRFYAVRLGIGKPVDKSRIEGYVLEPFRKEEQDLLPEVIERAADASAEIALNGPQAASDKQVPDKKYRFSKKRRNKER